MKRLFALLIVLAMLVTGTVFPARAADPAKDTTTYGDVDGDSNITAADALVVLKMAVGKQPVKDDAMAKAADVTGDYLSGGKITYNAADALEILKLVVGRTKLFPAEKLNPYATPIYDADGVLTEGQEVDFVLEFPEDHQVKILMLCDIHLAIHPSRWIWPYVEESIAQTDPDLIVLNGDSVHGDYDYYPISIPEYSGEHWKEMCDVMDSYEIPWLFNMGNHERTGPHYLDWMLETIQNSQYGILASADCTGDSNYTVAIKQGDEYTQLIYVVDTNGTTATMPSNPNKDRIELRSGAFPDQLSWLQRTNHRITYDLGEQIPSMMFMHEAPGFVNDIVINKYGPLDVIGQEVFIPDQEGDYGWSLKGSPPMGAASEGLYDVVQEIGCRNMYFGHTHSTPVSIKDANSDLRINWGLKSGWSVSINEERTLEDGTWLIGGSLITIDPKTKDAHMEHYLTQQPKPPYDL